MHSALDASTNTPPTAFSGDTAQAAEALDLALALGILAVENGGSTSMADEVFQHVLAGMGVRDGFAVWHIDSATAGRSAHRGAVVTRPIGAIGENFRRVAEIDALAIQARRGSLDRIALSAGIERIRTLGSPYPQWITLVATACTGGFFVRLTTGQWSGFTVAFVAAALGYLVWDRLGRVHAPGTVKTACGATASAIVAAAGLRLTGDAVTPATLVAAVIYLVPGVPLINGFVDVGTQKYLNIGTQRITSAAFLCTLLAVGVALAVSLFG